jgi:hypothetical protein
MQMVGVFWLGFLLACQPDRYCPKGLMPIPKDSPQYCIMKYEAVVQNGKAISQKGRLPRSLISYSDALDICRATPFYSKSGEKVGYMRLASLQEWWDAGDGMIGEGGTKYPWGETKDVDRCVLQGLEGLTKHQPSGSKPTCCSIFEVCDQLGNLWEWVDSGQFIDIAKWFEERETEGGSLKVLSNNIAYSGGDWSNYLVHSSEFQAGQLISNEAGILSLRLSKSIGRPAGGYLRPKKVSNVNQRHLLPISLDFSNNQIVSVIEIDWDRDKEPISIKLGGSFYSGSDADLRASFYGHSPDFNGSIGFRCSSSVIEN